VSVTQLEVDLGEVSQALEAECRDRKKVAGRVGVTKAQITAVLAGIGAQQGVNVVDWLAGMKTRPNARWLYVQVLRDLGFQFEADHAEEEDDDEAGHAKHTLGTIAVVGGKYDPEGAPRGGEHGSTPQDREKSHAGLEAACEGKEGVAGPQGREAHYA